MKEAIIVFGIIATTLYVLFKGLFSLQIKAKTSNGEEEHSIFELDHHLWLFVTLTITPPLLLILVATLTVSFN